MVSIPGKQLACGAGCGVPCLSKQDVENLATMHEEVTIIFADVKGFTAMSQELTPREVSLICFSC